MMSVVPPKADPLHSFSLTGHCKTWSPKLNHWSRHSGIRCRRISGIQRKLLITGYRITVPPCPVWRLSPP